MSIFGDMDTTEIGDDPFFTAAGTYKAVCSDASIQTKEEKGTSLVIDWTIDEPDSDFNGNNVREYFALFPGQAYASLDANEKKRLMFLKKRLRDGFDLSEEEMAAVNPSDLIGSEAYLTLVVNEGKGDKIGQKFTNVRNALSQRRYVEVNESSAASSSLGI